MRTTLRLLLPAAAICVGLVMSAVLGGTAAYAEPTTAELEQQITDKSNQLEKVVEQYNELNEQLNQTKTQIASLQQSLPQLEAQSKAAQTRVAAIAKTTYRTTGISGATALLGGGDGRNVLMRLGALQQLAETQRQTIADAQLATAHLNVAQRDLNARVAEQSSRLATIATQKAGIESELDKLNQLKIQARGYASSGGSRWTGPIPAVSGKAGIAVTFAYNAIGTPYVWAAEGPDGYDCSGLTKAAWGAAGVSLAHYTVTQWNQTIPISRGDLAPGDLVFYENLGHVALYVGNGQVIHAPTFGEVVKISSIDMMTPDGYRRVT